MSRIKTAGGILSHRQKNIIYFVSDDREIIEQMINGNKYVFAQRLSGKIDEDRGYFAGGNTYAKLSERYIENCHYLMKSSIFDSNGLKTAECKTSACIFVCTDFHLMDEKQQGMLLRQFIDYGGPNGYILMISSPVLSLPLGFEHIAEVIDVPSPDEEDIHMMLQEKAEYHAGLLRETLDQAAWNRIEGAVKDFKGLERDEIEAILDELMVEFGSFYGRSAVQRGGHLSDNIAQIENARRKKVRKIKEELAIKDPTITILEESASIAGFKNYKAWLSPARIQAFKNPGEAATLGRKPVRGVLIAGVPGTGKTQGAKFTASMLDATLVQLRMDGLLGRLMGDSEKNFKRCRKKIESLAPCVVLIDEIEKLFSQNTNNSSEVKMNILSALLDWMQENTKEIFFYATCNSLKMPPELFRDGRFSMRFSCFLPSYSELIEIIQFHMQRIDTLSCGRVFGNTAGIVEISHEKGEEIRKILPTVAIEFLDALISDKNRRPFFTGANIEALIDNAQYHLSDGRVSSKDAYLSALIECAQSEFCQPYGETNLKDSVSFWVDALEYSFTDAGDYEATAPVPFSSFDRRSGKFTINPDRFENKYDKKMFEVFSTEITREYKRRCSIDGIELGDDSDGK